MEKYKNVDQKLISREEIVKKTTTFNGGDIFWLFEADPKIQEEWEKRIICALCFVRKFFEERGIKTKTPYKVFLCASYTQTKSLLYEKSGGMFILQPNAASAVLRDVLFAEQRTKAWMDVHEYIHILMNDLIRLRSGKVSNKKKHNLPMWYSEGLAQYIQGEKDGDNYFDMARSLKHLPPFVLKAMNTPTEKHWLEFGIMDQRIVTGNHPGLTACASFVQFLIEKERIGFNKVWDLIYFQGSIQEFYKKIAELAGKSLYIVLNNYLYYVDKPYFPEKSKTWSMPVAVARDFRGEFTFEDRSFEVLKDILSN